MMRVPPTTDGAHANQVVRGKAHQRLPCQLGLPYQFGLGQTTHGLYPAKGLFDALSHTQAGLVAFVSLGTSVNGRVLRLGRHVRGNTQLATAFDKGLAVIALVGTHGELAAFALLTREHFECCLPLCRATGMGDFDVHHQPMAVVHEDVTHVAQAGFVTCRLLEQPCIGVRRAGVGVVAALLAFEVDLGVAPRRRCLVVVLALETLVRGPGFNQCAVHAEVFVAGQLRPAGGVLDPLEEHAGQVFVEEPLAVGAEGGVVPDLVFQGQAHEPAVQQVVVDGLDQQPLAADREQDLQQQGLEQHFGRYRRAAVAGIHRLELRRHGGQQSVNHRAQFAQWVFGRYPVFEADVAEHRPLKVLCASHIRCLVSCRRRGSHGTGSRAGQWGVFQRPVKRWTAKRKTALILDIIQGKTSVAEASRAYDLPPSEIEEWVDEGKKGMENALRTKPLEVKEQYERQLRELQEAYGEAMLELRARKKLASLLGNEDEK